MLAAAPEEEVLRLWSGLGYYSRVRNLQKAAKLIVANHNAIFPCNPAEALALPGIGAYTAAAILSIAYQKKLAVLDGNVARVIARLQAVRGDLRANGTWQSLQESADHLLQPASPGDWNQAMMELGATLCTPRSPQCLLCPVGEFCEARKQGLANLIPEKRAKRSTVEITLASLVLLDRRGKTLLLAPPKSAQKSPAPDDVHTLVSRMWHFPTISVQHGQAAAALTKFAEESFFSARKLRMELQPLQKVRHAVTYRSITVLPFRLEVENLPKVSAARAFPLADLSSVAVSNLTRKVARAALASK
jgi:A/G-specific adenine glycosylase